MHVHVVSSPGSPIFSTYEMLGMGPGNEAKADPG